MPPGGQLAQRRRSGGRKDCSLLHGPGPCGLQGAPAATEAGAPTGKVDSGDISETEQTRGGVWGERQEMRVPELPDSGVWSDGDAIPKSGGPQALNSSEEGQAGFEYIASHSVGDQQGLSEIPV